MFIIDVNFSKKLTFIENISSCRDRSERSQLVLALKSTMSEFLLQKVQSVRKNLVRKKLFQNESETPVGKTIKTPLAKRAKIQAISSTTTKSSSFEPTTSANSTTSKTLNGSKKIKNPAGKKAPIGTLSSPPVETISVGAASSTIAAQPSATSVPPSTSPSLDETLISTGSPVHHNPPASTQPSSFEPTSANPNEGSKTVVGAASSTIAAQAAPPAFAKAMSRSYIDLHQLRKLFPEYKISPKDNFQFESFYKHSSAWTTIEEKMIKNISGQRIVTSQFSIDGYVFCIWKAPQNGRISYCFSAMKGKMKVLHEAIIDEKTWHAKMLGYDILTFFCEIEHWHHVLVGLTSYFMQLANEEFVANCFAWTPVRRKYEPNLWYYFKYCFFPDKLTEWHVKSKLAKCNGVELFKML